MFSTLQMFHLTNVLPYKCFSPYKCFTLQMKSEFLSNHPMCGCHTHTALLENSSERWTDSEYDLEIPSKLCRTCPANNLHGGNTEATHLDTFLHGYIRRICVIL